MVSTSSLCKVWLFPIEFLWKYQIYWRIICMEYYCIMWWLLTSAYSALTTSTLKTENDSLEIFLVLPCSRPPVLGASVNLFSGLFYLSEDTSFVQDTSLLLLISLGLGTPSTVQAIEIIVSLHYGTPQSAPDSYPSAGCKETPAQPYGKTPVQSRFVPCLGEIRVTKNSHRIWTEDLLRSPLPLCLSTFDYTPFVQSCIYTVVQASAMMMQ